MLGEWWFWLEKLITVASSSMWLHAGGKAVAFTGGHGLSLGELERQSGLVTSTDRVLIRQRGQGQGQVLLPLLLLLLLCANLLIVSLDSFPVWSFSQIYMADSALVISCSVIGPTVGTESESQSGPDRTKD